MSRKLTAVLSVVIIASLCRLLPHAPNFTPLAAVALFSGAYIRNRWLAVAMPLMTMLLSDALLGFNGWIFVEQVITVYVTYAIIALMGTTMNKRAAWYKVGAGSLASSIIFFVTTNFAVWMGGFFHAPALYPMNFGGLVECYAAAVPFFRNTLASDMFYNVLLFGGFYLASINIPALSQE